ncbi:MAG: DUF2815 family protein [Eubacteriales bacterium]
MATNRPTQVTTNEVRISYEHLLRPYVKKQGDEPKYSATLLIPKSDVITRQRIDAAIQAAIQEGVTSRWNGVRPPSVPLPIHDGDGVRPSDGLPFSDECRGHWVISASSKQQPDIVDLSLQKILDATQVYSGIYARVNINFFAYFSNGKKGIGCGLGPVQKTRDGEPLGGRTSAEEAFGGVPQPQYQQAPAYQPAPVQPPQYQPQPQYAPQPTYTQPYQPAPAQHPQYQPAPQPSYAQPAPAPAPAVDPITGLPVQPPIFGI